MQVRSSSERVGPALNRDIQTKIGQQLRAIYDDVVDQGVPDRFVELLRSLDKETGKGERGDEDSSE
ncbi:MAG: NepR family anti-sigma factor [Xanthobacteraceae bacterium]